MDGDHKTVKRVWSFADLITLLLVVLVVVYGAPQIDQRPFRQAADWVRALVAGRGAVPATSLEAPPAEQPPVSEPPSVASAAPAAEPKPKAPEPLPDLGFAGDSRFNRRDIDQGVLISIAGTGSFDSGSAELNPRLEELLSVIADRLKPTTYPIRLEGYADAVPIYSSTFKSNQELSQARANRVRDFLEQRGIDPARMEAVGRGEIRVDYAHDTPEGRAKNRRVDVLVLWDAQTVAPGPETFSSKK